MASKPRTYKPGLVAKGPYVGWCPWESCGQEVTARQGREHSSRHQREDMQKEVNRRVQKLLKDIAKEKAEQASRKADEYEGMADSTSEPAMKSEYRRRAIELRKEAAKNA